jgi:hypothetical protein
MAGRNHQEPEDIGLAGDSELSPELLLWRGNVTLTPSPLPVREGAVYQVSNHEVMDSSEHQSRLSKGVIAKVVQTLGLGSAIQAGAPAARAAGFAPLSLTPGLWARSDSHIPSRCGAPTFLAN